jgi:hypothetical protein
MKCGFKHEQILQLSDQMNDNTIVIENVHLWYTSVPYYVYPRNNVLYHKRLIFGNYAAVLKLIPTNNFQIR